jgi:hypothetical protein
MNLTGYGTGATADPSQVSAIAPYSGVQNYNPGAPGALQNMGGGTPNVGGGTTGVNQLRYPSGQGQNQWGSYPMMSNMATGGGFNTPYGAGGFGTGSQTGMFSSSFPPSSYYGSQQGYGGFYPGGTISSAPGLSSVGKGYQAGTTYDPALTSSLFGYLQSQIGQPSPMYPGQLTAPPNVNLSDLSSYLSGGPSNIPGSQQLTNIAQTGGGVGVEKSPGFAGLLQMSQTGNPINVMPEWQSMVNAMQQNTAQQAADLKEQLSAGGNLVGTPYGTTMQDFYSNIGAQQQALLGQLSTQAQQQAVQNMLSAQGTLGQLGLTGQEANITNMLGAQGQIMGQVLPTSAQQQGIQQAGLANAYQEWLRTQPQYNPLMNYMFGAGTTFPPYLFPGASSSPFSNLGQGLGTLLGNIYNQQPTNTPPGPSPGPGGSPLPGPTGGNGGGGGGGGGNIPNIPGVDVWGQTGTQQTPVNTDYPGYNPPATPPGVTSDWRTWTSMGIDPFTIPAALGGIGTGGNVPTDVPNQTGNIPYVGGGGYSGGGGSDTMSIV